MGRRCCHSEIIQEVVEFRPEAQAGFRAAVLCQRPEPGRAPKIIAVITQGFADVQQRWSAMERELYALWQGVTGHERMMASRSFATSITRITFSQRRSWITDVGVRRCQIGRWSCSSLILSGSGSEVRLTFWGTPPVGLLGRPSWSDSCRFRTCPSVNSCAKCIRIRVPGQQGHSLGAAAGGGPHCRT